MFATFFISLFLFFVIFLILAFIRKPDPMKKVMERKQKSHTAGSKANFSQPAFKSKHIARDQLDDIIANPRDINPIFTKKNGSSYLRDGIVITTPYLEWVFPLEEVRNSFRKDVAVIIYQFYDLAEKLGLQFEIIYDRVVLSHWAWFNNYETNGFLLAEFEASFSLDWNRYVEYGEHDPRKAGLEYSILANVRIEFLDGEQNLEHIYIDDYKELDQIKSFSQVRHAAKNFTRFFREACDHPSICAKSNLLCDLEECPGNIPQQIYKITCLDRDGKIHKDRICDLHYSIYSPPSQVDIKWIFAFSEKEKKFRDFKIANIQSCEPMFPFEMGLG